MAKRKVSAQEVKNASRVKDFKGGVKSTTKQLYGVDKAMETLFEDAKEILNDKDYLKYRDLFSRLMQAEMSKDENKSKSIQDDLNKLYIPYEKVEKA